MKDRTHSMNMDFGGDGAVNGYTDAGKPSTRREQKMKQLRTAGLDEVLRDECVNEAAEMENAGNKQPGGFLPRQNFDDRF